MLVKRASLLKAAFAMSILDLISRAYRASFAIIDDLSKCKLSSFCGWTDGSTVVSSACSVWTWKRVTSQGTHVASSRAVLLCPQVTWGNLTILFNPTQKEWPVFVYIPHRFWDFPAPVSADNRLPCISPRSCKEAPPPPFQFDYEQDDVMEKKHPNHARNSNPRLYDSCAQGPSCDCFNARAHLSCSCRHFALRLYFTRCFLSAGSSCNKSVVLMWHWSGVTLARSIVGLFCSYGLTHAHTVDRSDCVSCVDVVQSQYSVHGNLEKRSYL